MSSEFGVRWRYVNRANFQNKYLLSNIFAKSLSISIVIGEELFSTRHQLNWPCMYISKFLHLAHFSQIAILCWYSVCRLIFPFIRISHIWHAAITLQLFDHCIITTKCTIFSHFCCQPWWRHSSVALHSCCAMLMKPSVVCALELDT